MDLEFVQSFAVGRPTAAEICGLPDSTLANWLARYPLAPGGLKGSGRSHAFRLPDLTRVAAVKALTELGLDAKKAAGLIEPFSSPYGVLLHDRGVFGMPPGLLLFSLTRDEVLPAFDPGARACVFVNAWALFDDIWPRFRSVILADPGPRDPTRARSAVEAFEAQIAELRVQRFSERN